MVDGIEYWITVNGNHIPVKSGQSKEEAVNSFLKEKGDARGKTTDELRKEQTVRTKEITFVKSVPKEFHSQLTSAKASVNEADRWRVDIHDEADYTNDKLFTTVGGSCVAVEPDGNIISVCKNNSDSTVNGKDLLNTAIENGGDRLDSFSFLYGFYIRQGFEPVSWVAFDEQYAPDGWDKNKDKKEPVIFYKYTGKVSNETFEEFKNRVKPSEDYGTAKSIRDKEIKK